VLNKHSMLFFGSGLAPGLLLTPARKVFSFTVDLVRRGSGFSDISSQSVVGNPQSFSNDRALAHRYRHEIFNRFADRIHRATGAARSPACGAPVWLLGLWFFLRDAEGRKYAFLAWAYFVVLAEMILLHGKIYYLAPAYIMLLAGGAVWIEKHALPRTGFWLKPVLIVPLLLGAAIAAPLAMPILPVRQAIHYCALWDVKAVHVENVPLGELPQLFGDMFGWEEQVQAVSRAYASLPFEERPRAALLDTTTARPARSIILASVTACRRRSAATTSMDIGARADIPVKLWSRSGFRWRNYSDHSMTSGHLKPLVLRNAMPEETNLTIYICRKQKQPFSASWAEWMYLD